MRCPSEGLAASWDPGIVHRIEPRFSPDPARYASARATVIVISHRALNQTRTDHVCIDAIFD